MAGEQDRRGKRCAPKADAKQRRLELDKQQRPPADKQMVGGRDK